MGSQAGRRCALFFTWMWMCQRWTELLQARIVIWMSGPSFDEVFKVSQRPNFTFSNVIFPQSNYIMNNLWLAHKPSSHIWTVSVPAFICL